MIPAGVTARLIRRQTVGIRLPKMIPDVYDFPICRYGDLVLTVGDLKVTTAGFGHTKFCVQWDKGPKLMLRGCDI